MPNANDLTEVNPRRVVSDWLLAFETAVKQNDPGAASALFLKDGHWRDLEAFTWHLETVSGTESIEALLARTLPNVQPRNFRIAADRTPPRVVKRAGVENIEAIICLDTSTGPVSGILRLVRAPSRPDEFRAWILLTTLDDIQGHEQNIGHRRPRGEEWSGGFGEENWLDARLTQLAYEDREPTVVVVGGSQCGLGIAACLGVLGIDALVVDKHERVGDAWRKRYRNLTLHNEVFVDHMPYLPFPPNYPVYIPRDKIANWLEFYADTMELNVWNSTEFISGRFDEQNKKWALEVRRENGTVRTLRPRHVIFAMGVSAIPVKPDLPGLRTFAGELLHSSQFSSGSEWKGRRGIVLGTGNSGHDVAHDLHMSGVDTTIVQRSSTLIVSLKEAQRVYDLYQEGSSIEDCDLIATASPYPVLVQGYKIAAKAMAEGDKELLEGLRARGFRLDFGPPDDTGYQMKYLRRGGGYYFNVGCSDLIVDGKIKLEHHRDIESVVPEGLKMSDGRIIAADVIVTATGYKNQQDVVRYYLGEEIAARVGRVWGFDEGGEMHNMWRRTPQPGLWFVGGGLPHVRIYSKYLAQQIKGVEEGLIGPLRNERCRPAEVDALLSEVAAD